MGRKQNALKYGQEIRYFFWQKSLQVEIVSYEYKFVGLLYLWLYQIMVVAHDVSEKVALSVSQYNKPNNISSSPPVKTHI